MRPTANTPRTCALEDGHGFGPGLSQSACSRLVSGQTRMDMDRLVAISKVLGVPPWELVLPEDRP